MGLPDFSSFLLRNLAVYSANRSLEIFVDVEVWPGGVDNLSTYHREQRLDRPNLIRRHGHIILRQNGKVGELAGLERTAFLVVPRKPRAADCVGSEGVFASRRLIGRAVNAAAIFAVNG